MKAASALADEVRDGSPASRADAAHGILVSGVKPSGAPHLGNLVGMMRPTVATAAKLESYVFVADLHALTTVHEPDLLRGHVHDVAAALVAAGLDPERTALFRQSDVPEVLELAWILACLTPVGLLERAHAYKAARAEGRSPTLGLFSYPVLMAADILVFRGEVVPVGPDQEQHVEIAREVARRFNQAFGETFPLPRAELADPRQGAIPGLDGRKMSKQYGNTIPLAATEAERRRLVRRIVTDSSPAGAPKEPDGAPVMELYRRFATPAEAEALAERLRRGDADWLEAKNALADALVREVEPVRRRFAALRGDPAALDALLAEGAVRARSRARETLAIVRDRTGMGAARFPSHPTVDAPDLDERLDDALRMTFPASDPIAIQ